MFVILSIVAVSILYWCYAKYRLNYWKRLGVEQIGNESLLFGNFKQAILFRTSPGWHIADLYHSVKTNAPFVGFYIFHKPCLLLKDPEIIKQIFIRDFENFSDRHFAGPQQRDSIGMVNLFGVNNPAWRYLRRKVSPTLTKGKLKQMIPFMTEIGQNMLTHLESEKVRNDGTRLVDIQGLNDVFTTDFISTVALGTKSDSFNNPNQKFRKNVAQFLHGFKRMTALVCVFFAPELVDRFGTSVLYDMSFLKKIFWSAVEEREKTGVKKGDFVDSLMQLRSGDQDSVFKLDGDNLMHQAGMFFSGIESSGTVTSFTIMELARYKEHQDEARKDVLRAIEKHGWGYEALDDMKYLEQCVFEGMRLHPSVPTADRRARDDYKIPGTDIVIPAGTPIYVSLGGIHADAQYFEDPETFDPTRFNMGKNISDAYMPFGLGPRSCVGKKLGLVHAKAVIAMILKDYEVRESPDHKSFLDPRHTFTTAKNGITLHFTKLNSAA